MDPLIITFITASTALIAGIASPIVSISIARRQFKASVIANNREKWIEALREAIAEYIAIVTSVALIAHHGRAIGEVDFADEEEREAAERLVFVRLDFGSSS